MYTDWKSVLEIEPQIFETSVHVFEIHDQFPEVLDGHFCNHHTLNCKRHMTGLLNNCQCCGIGTALN